MNEGTAAAKHRHHYRLDILHWIIMALSVLLIVFISIDTFSGINFLDDGFCHFQFWDCIEVFMADFFIELALAPDKLRYTRNRLLYLLLSVPYLNIIRYCSASGSHRSSYFSSASYPWPAASLAMVIVVGAFSRNRLTSFLSSYIVILAAFIYLRQPHILLLRAGESTPMSTISAPLSGGPA